MVWKGDGDVLKDESGEELKDRDGNVYRRRYQQQLWEEGVH